MSCKPVTWSWGKQIGQPPHFTDFFYQADNQLTNEDCCSRGCKENPVVRNETHGEIMNVNDPINSLCTVTGSFGWFKYRRSLWCWSTAITSKRGKIFIVGERSGDYFRWMFHSSAKSNYLICSLFYLVISSCFYFYVSFLVWKAEGKLLYHKVFVFCIFSFFFSPSHPVTNADCHTIKFLAW